MNRDEIKPQHTYKTKNGLYLYVHDIDAGGIVYCNVGHTARLKASLGRFAAMVEAEVPNQ